MPEPTPPGGPEQEPDQPIADAIRSGTPAAASVAVAAAVPRTTGGPLQSGRREGWLFKTVCGGAAWSSLVMLALLLGTVLFMGAGRLSWEFLSSFDSYIDPQKAGILAGLWGSIWLMILTMLIAVPVGIGAAVYLEEYAKDNWLNRLIRINLSNLAGVPSIVYGILGLTAFVRMFDLFSPTGYASRLVGGDIEAVLIGPVRIPLPFGSTVISGALTLSLLVLPVVIVASQEALRAVLSSIREASLALGATRWQTIRDQVLPSSLPGILTGVILAISRAVGETAPLVMVGAAVFLRRTPGGITRPWEILNSPGSVAEAPFDVYTALPMVIYNWAKYPPTADAAYQQAAAAGIVVLLTSLLMLNAGAILIRNRFQRRIGR